MANPEDLGRYRLHRLLGRGALGEVWEANDLELGNKVVVKIMHAADDELAMARSHFAREARLASLMRHPHVAAVHDAGEAAGTSFMVMDMVEGKSLRPSIGDKSISMTQRLRWLRQIGDGLSAMHRAGVVHRDLKPENVIVRPDGTVCLVDLGIAKWTKFDLGAERDMENEIEAFVEAPHMPSDYRPPETGDDGFYDELGDQYAWGVLAYEMVTGEVPKEGTSEPLVSRTDLPEAVPPEVAAAIDRARSTERADRWDGMEALLDELIDHAASKRPPRASATSGGSANGIVATSSSSGEDPDAPPTKPSGGTPQPAATTTTTTAAKTATTPAAATSTSSAADETLKTRTHSSTGAIEPKNKLPPIVMILLLLVIVGLVAIIVLTMK